MGDAQPAPVFVSQHPYYANMTQQQQPQQHQHQQYTEEQYFAMLQQQQQQQQQQQHNNPYNHNNNGSSGSIQPHQTQSSSAPSSSSKMVSSATLNNANPAAAGNTSASGSGTATTTTTSSKTTTTTTDGSPTKARRDSMDSGNEKDGASRDASHQKFSRSKGACQQCRSVKQRCSGASRHPCERCQLYKLECIFSKDPPPPKDPTKQPVKKPATKQASIDPEAGAAVLHSLRAITERLRTIEDQIAVQNKNFENVSISGPSSERSKGQFFGFDGDTKTYSPNGFNGEAHPENAANDITADPVSTVSSAIRDLDQMLANASRKGRGGSNVGSPASPLGSSIAAASDRGSSPRGTLPSQAGSHASREGRDKKAFYDPDVPDAISRGFVTVEEAQQLFDFYFQRCAQWTPPLDYVNDRNMYHVRRRSTFLFHSILAVASYFCYVPQGENGLRKYYAIVTTLVESLAPIVVCPNPSELTVDLLFGLLICILWKPVRCGSQMQLGPSGFAELQAQSKINPSSGYVLGGLALRIAQLLSIGRKACNLSSPPNDKETVNACRQWLWINLIDSQSALAEGKQPALDPSDALRITRLFASCKAKPGDVRLAAMVELYAAVVPIVAMHHGAPKTDFRALYRANSVLDKLTAYWAPRIEDAYKGGDPLAATFPNVFAPFVRLVLNADVFRTWLIRQKSSSPTGEVDIDNARATLTNEEAHCIGFAVQAAEEMLYYLSTQSKGDGAARKHDWAARDMSSGHRPPLNLDQDVAKMLASSIDQILLVIFAFPPLFLAQLRASNLVNCDLDMAPEITNDLWSVGFPAKSLLPASKFMRLMELSAEFYEATAPNNDFPSVEQATLLRSISCLSVPEDAPAPPQYSTSNAPAPSLMDGQACLVPGALNTEAISNWNPSLATRAHQQYMQQINNTTPGTNPSLAFPYNNMVFSNDGADKLDMIMQHAVPDPSASSSLLGSFAKVDADWNAYFSPTAVANYTFSDPGSAASTGNALNVPSDMYGLNSTYAAHSSSNSGLNVPAFKPTAPSPDSFTTFFGGGNHGYSNSSPAAQTHQQTQYQQRQY